MKHINLRTDIKIDNHSVYPHKYINTIERPLGNKIVDKTNQPEDEDKNDEKYRIDHLHKGLAEINFPVTLILAPGLGLGDRSLPESVYVGLHEGVDKGFEETEDQPAVDHLDVGGVGQIGAHTNNEYFYKMKRLDSKTLSLKKVLSELA